MSIQLSNRVQSIPFSATIAMAIKARALKSEGKPVIDFGVGEPDFDTPLNIKKAAEVAIDQGFTKYTPVDGILDLRTAFAKKLKDDNQLDYDPTQIMVSNGCKQCIYNLTESILNPGDETIIISPYWVSYPHMITLSGAKPVVISTGIEAQFKITPEALEQAITPKTRLFLINSPSNPTGKAYSRKELEKLGAVLSKYPDIIIATDDIYEHILFGKEPYCNIVMACPNLYERTVILHGVSKTYAMTGWRIGLAAGPKPLIQAMTKIQSQSTSGACSIAQKAAVAALTGDQSAVQEMVKAYKIRHDFLLPALNDIPGIECLPADGTFYLFPKVQKLIDRLKDKPKSVQHSKVTNDHELADFLLNEAHVVTVPGKGFGADGYLRFSFATGLENLKEGMQRLKKLLTD